MSATNNLKPCSFIDNPHSALCDSHAHLAGLTGPQLDTTLDLAAAAGVTWILNTATDLASCSTVLAQSNCSSILRAAVGVSPFDVNSLPGDWHLQLAVYANHPATVAIGETGLDASNPRYPSMKNQVLAFKSHIDIARTTNKPLVLHSRGCERQVCDICRESGCSRALFHCFTGSVSDLHYILDAGYDVSLSGIVTFARPTLDDMVRIIPGDRLFIETDAPYLAPPPYRGKRNEPAYIRKTYEYIAEVKGVTIDELATMVYKNVISLFCQQEAPMA